MTTHIKFIALNATQKVIHTILIYTYMIAYGSVYMLLQALKLLFPCNCLENREIQIERYCKHYTSLLK